MSHEKKQALVTPVNVPRYGICIGCGRKFQLVGSTLRGYTVSAHHSSDIEAARRGVNCSGSDKYPSVVLP